MTTAATEAEQFLVHFLSSITVNLDQHRAEVMVRASELLVTDTVREASIDRNGNSWLDLLDNPEAQELRYGRVVFARGPFPAGELTTEPGTPEHEAAAWRAHRDAEHIVNTAERRRALDSARAAYGEDATRTSRTLSEHFPEEAEQ